MRTDFVKQYAESEDGKIANDIIRRCVHCGFCNATCPTYQLLGDELDGPRGRIYLIKQMLEGNEVSVAPVKPRVLPVWNIPDCWKSVEGLSNAMCRVVIGKKLNVEH